MSARAANDNAAYIDAPAPPAAMKKGSAGIERNRYTPFGIAMDDNPDLANQGGFTGHIKDAATGLNYMQARYYDPVMGRFLSIDPVTFLDQPYPGQFNRYAYTWNDPINATDPNGEFLIIVKSVYNVGKRTYKNGGNLKGALKDEALSYVENGATLLSKDASLGDKAFAIFDLATGFGDEAKGAKRLLGSGKSSPTATVNVSAAKHPEAAKHITDAQNAGHPSVLTIARDGAADNRSEAL